MRLINQFSPPRRPKHWRLSNIIDELRLCDNLQLALGAVTPLTLIANNRRARLFGRGDLVTDHPHTRAP